MLYRTEYTHGGDIYTDEILLDFSSNTNPFGPPEAVLNAMKEAVMMAEHYPDPFCREAVRAISEHERVPQDHILLGNGAAELIYSFCAAVRPGSALETAPTFSEYAAAVKAAGGHTRQYFLRQENGFAPDRDMLTALSRWHHDVFFLCNPNNPTGGLIDPGLLHEILECCSERNIRLFLDECFLDFTGSRSGMSAFLDTYPNLFILKALTKNYALAGIRVGYCLSSDKDLLQRMAQSVQPWNVSVIAQAAAAAAMQEEAYLAKTSAMIPAERARLKTALESFGFWVCPSDANFLLFRGSSGLDTALRGEKIAVRNCSDYAGLGPDWYRIAVRLHDENETLIKAIASIMGKDA